MAIDLDVQPNGDINVEVTPGDTIELELTAVGPMGPQGEQGPPGPAVVETDPVVGAIDGIVKADGAGNISAATNTDSEIATAVIKANSALQAVENDPSPKAGGEFDFQAHSAGFTQQVITSSGGAATIDWRLGNKASITLAENVTFTFTAPSKPGNLLLKMTNDAIGGYDVTWPASVKWLGSEPTWTDGGASKTIIATFYYDGSTYWAQATRWEV